MSRGGPSSARLVTVVLVSLVVVLAGLGISVAVVGGVADGVRAAASRLTSASAGLPARSHTVTEKMEILTGTVQRQRHIVTRFGQDFGPMYTHAFWSVHVGDTVVVRITSYDTGPAPLTGSQMMYDRVEGTLGGVETVDGASVRTVPNDEVAHTFTVVGLGLNLPIPAAPSTGPVTVVARFVARRAGTFVWQCYAPCGSGPNMMGGPMATMRWMEGKVKVLG